MASTSPSLRLRSVESFVVVILLAAGLAIAAAWLRGWSPGIDASGQSFTSRPSNASQVLTAKALPVPDGMAVVAVLDPQTEAPSITAEEAVTIARADGSNLVGRSPIVQLVRTSASWPGSKLDGFTGWIVFSTDVPGYLWPPHIPNAPTPRPIIATYSYTFVSLDGTVVSALQLTFQVGDDIPPIP